jgi:aspartate aminotransferase-like enzyme
VVPEILAHMARPIIGHRGEEMQAILGEIITRAREVFGAASHDIFLTGSSATGLWEAAVRNGVARRLLVPVCGAFSERFFEVAQACGIAADRIDADWGRAVDPAALHAALATGAYDAVALVHNETSTGVVNPLGALAEAVRRHPDVLLFVDVVSSLAGMPVLVDRHGIDVALASVSHIFALQAQLRRIAAEGLEARYARHRAMADLTRAWASDRFDLFAEAAARSETVTCVRNNRSLDVGAFSKRLKGRGYAISNGYGRLKEATFRIGHMGDHTVEGVRRLLAAMDEVLEGGAA